MNLQTNISLKPRQHNQIDYESRLLLLGSCFTENIGKKLDYFKFRASVNPLGILFHPKAIETLITNAINEKEYTEKDIFFLNEQWHCFEVHSKLSNPNKKELLHDLNTAIKQTNQLIKESLHIIITLGTAWVYRFIETDTIVANCHKVPQKKFLKELLTIDKITESLDAILVLIKSVNPNATVIFTVSPVRHLKDGFVENNRSKAHLLASIHNAISNHREKPHYFPSYEIMLDELRDYRFYAEDMIHPNQTAINYIWEKFCHVWIPDKTQQIMLEIDTIQKGLQHKPFNPNSEQHITFLQNLKQKQEDLKHKFPFLNF